MILAKIHIGRYASPPIGRGVPPGRDRLAAIVLRGGRHRPTRGIEALARCHFVTLTLARNCLAALLWIVFAVNGVATAATRLSFNDLPPNTYVTTQYAVRGTGVVFPYWPYLYVLPWLNGGKPVLRSYKDQWESGERLVVTFTSPQTLVRVLAGGQGVGTLHAFSGVDGGGALIAQDAKPMSTAAFTTPLEVKTASPSIRSVIFEIALLAYGGISELYFEGEAPAPIASAPPVVHITSPPNNAQLDYPSGPLAVQGTVTGEQLLPFVLLELGFSQPAGYAGLPYTDLVPLTGSGTTRTFSSVVMPAMGPNRLSVEAENTAGKGNDTVLFASLSPAI